MPRPLPRLRRMCGGGLRTVGWTELRRVDDALIHDRSGWALARGWSRRETTAAVVRRWARTLRGLPAVAVDAARVRYGWWLCDHDRHDPIRIIDKVRPGSYGEPVVQIGKTFAVPAEVMLGPVASLHLEVVAEHRECVRCGTVLP